MIDAYSSGVQAFKGLREKAGLTEDKIDETMSDIQEVVIINIIITTITLLFVLGIPI